MRIRSALGCLLAVGVVGAAVPAAGAAKTKFTRLGNDPGTGGVTSAFTRSANGRLHVLFPSSAGGADGLTLRSSNLSGVFGPSISALPTVWGVSAPGLAAFPNGTLAAFFGADSPVPPHPDGTWEITSTDNGATWSGPQLVNADSPLTDQAYGAAVSAQMQSGSAPVLLLNVSGTLVVQYGLGAGALVQRVDTAADGAPTAVDSAVDAGTGSVVAAWDSLAGSGGDYLQTVAPSLGTPQKLPGRERNEVTIAGRDQGPGVFAAYTTDNRHVRLMRYGGGSVVVGSLKGVTPAGLGVATGIDGRIWVMWGSDDGHLAITRSNKAVTRFEPLQSVNVRLTTLTRLYGDGRLGPLNLLVDELPAGDKPVPGVYEAKIRPELSAAVTVTPVTAGKKPHQHVVAHQLKVEVTDAGDDVPGATVHVEGATKHTNVHGVATLTVPGASPGTVDVTAQKPTYQKLVRPVKLG